MENKKRFSKPQAETIVFSADDVILTSPVTIGDGSVPTYEEGDGNN